jgi:hypothetical protein
MLRILIADDTPAAMQAERETFGIPSIRSRAQVATASYPLLVDQCCRWPTSAGRRVARRL